MPQVTDEWIGGSRLLLPRQNLEASEVDAFIGFVFRSIANALHTSVA